MIYTRIISFLVVGCWFFIRFYSSSSYIFIYSNSWNELRTPPCWEIHFLTSSVDVCRISRSLLCAWYHTSAGFCGTGSWSEAASFFSQEDALPKPAESIQSGRHGDRQRVERSEGCMARELVSVRWQNYCRRVRSREESTVQAYGGHHFSATFGKIWGVMWLVRSFSALYVVLIWWLALPLSVTVSGLLLLYCI